MSSNADSERLGIELERDVPTSAADVSVLGDLRRTAASWLHLTPGEIEALLPVDALRQRPPMRANARPFTLED